MDVEVMASYVFWFSVGLMVYIYAGYPVVIRALARFLGRGVATRDVILPTTIVVTAFNEAKGIRAKLDNLVSLDYPRELLEILVASDGSTDSTDDIVRSYPDPRVRLLRVEGRVGKTACQNQAVTHAKGEVVVFTDATTEIEPQALRLMVRNFADPEVGCVAAQLVYVGKGRNLTAAGGTAYWNYEIALRLAESKMGSLIGVSGCLYAVRRGAYRPIGPHLISDFVIAMRMREQKLRSVLEPAAVCFEDTLDRSREELSMRVRVSIRSIAAIVEERKFLNPFRYGWFAFQLWSHKALRYASPFIWAVSIGACLALLEYPFYRFCLAAQLAVLTAGALGFVIHARQGVPGLLGKPYYFVLTNLASLLAVFRYLRGERVRIWNPIRS
jgi:cellulose synthase/poly-beta-1,6-N-acetylglucosamine synthase-like glycosyltransferase